MDEFEVFEGRLKLRREMFWQIGDGQLKGELVLDMGVVGLAGAVSLTIGVGGFRAADGDPELAVSGDLQGDLLVHSYRPLPGLDEVHPTLKVTEDPFLYGGTGWVRTIGGTPEADAPGLLRRVVQPGGERWVWEQLEEAYQTEFVPAFPEQEQRERAARIAELALARAEGATHPPFAGDHDHVHRFPDGGGECVHPGCTVRWAGPLPDPAAQ